MRVDNPPGEGWFTPSEYAEHKSIKAVHAQRVLHDLFLAEKLERYQSRTRTVFYRIINGRNGQRG